MWPTNRPEEIRSVSGNNLSLILRIDVADRSAKVGSVMKTPRGWISLEASRIPGSACRCPRALLYRYRLSLLLSESDLHPQNYGETAWVHCTALSSGCQETVQPTPTKPRQGTRIPRTLPINHLSQTSRIPPQAGRGGAAARRRHAKERTKPLKAGTDIPASSLHGA